MTYCIGMQLDHGLVFMSDTRTNAGVDNFSTSKKMFHWHVPGERMITIMTAGNLPNNSRPPPLWVARSKAGCPRFS